MEAMGGSESVQYAPYTVITCGEIRLLFRRSDLHSPAPQHEDRPLSTAEPRAGVPGRSLLLTAKSLVFSLGHIFSFKNIILAFTNLLSEFCCG